MDIKVQTFTLLTKVMDARHTIVLRDWLEFLTVLPQDLVVYIPNQDDIHQALEVLCTDFQLTWKPVFVSPEDDLKNHETAVLLRMVNQVNSKYLLFVNLDTLPYRQGNEENAWLQDVFDKWWTIGGSFFRGVESCSMAIVLWMPQGIIFALNGLATTLDYCAKTCGCLRSKIIALRKQRRQAAPDFTQNGLWKKSFAKTICLGCVGLTR